LRSRKDALINEVFQEMPRRTRGLPVARFDYLPEGTQAFWGCFSKDIPL
jgi:hypothetical protein